MTIAIDLSGRSCLVLGGGGGGIGTAVALAAAAAGAGVAIVSNVDEHCADTVRRIEELGGRCTAEVADVTSETELVEAIGNLERLVGPIQHLVNVVGGNMKDEWYPAAEYDMAAFDRVLSRNLRYVLVSCREIAGRLIRSGLAGSIANISSIAARGTPLLAAYGAAKAGLESATRTMALEWAPHGVRVNVVAAGTIRTPRAGQGDMAGEAARSIPLRRRGEPYDIASAAMFLLSDLASYVTGQTVTVDGGMALGHPGGAELPRFVDKPELKARFSPSD
jgi:3-oxoacyl-[acyl-carrier protein] reductase